MTQQVQELINKIKEEGIQQAESKAAAIKAQAERDAEKIIAQAKQQAQQIVQQAQADSKKLNDSTHVALQQAGRDMLLQLRKQIQATLKAVVAQETKQALSAETLAHILQDVIKTYIQDGSGASAIIVTLNTADAKKLHDGFLAKLKEQIKKPLTLKSSDEIGAGFTISFDNGKSLFDFSDASLVGFLSANLNPQVATLLKEVVS